MSYLSYAKVKLNATEQDTPITLSQIRQLSENIEILKWHRRACLCLASYYDTTMIPNEYWQCPPVYFPVGGNTMRLLYGLKNASGGAITGAKFKIYYGDMGDDDENAVETEFDVSGSASSIETWEIPIPAYLQGQWATLRGSYIYQTAGTPVANLTWRIIGAWAHPGTDDTDAHNTSFPAWGEVADSRQLRKIAQDLYEINTAPMHVGTCLLPKAAASDSFVLIWNNYHLIDSADGNIGEESQYIAGVCLDTSTTSTHGTQCEAEHNNSADTSNINLAVNLGADRPGNYVQLPVAGESWDTGSSTESEVIVRVKKVTGSAVGDAKVRGVNLWMWEDPDTSVARSQGTYQTETDVDHFRLKTKQLIEVDTVEGLGRAVHNSIANKTGSLAAVYNPAVAAKTIATSYVTISESVIYSPSRWMSPDSSAQVSIIVTLEVTNNSGTNRDFYLRVTEQDNGQTAEDSVTVAAGSTVYHRFTGDLDVGYPPDNWYLPILIEAKASAPSTRVTIKSLTAGLYLGKSY